ncbi:bacteriocin [Bacillus cereus]|nr:bacteriocin [Bacillus cereus]
MGGVFREKVFSLVGCEFSIQTEKQNGSIAPVIYFDDLILIGVRAGLYDAWSEIKKK